MSNVKTIDAAARVPFNWLNDDDRLSTDDIAWLAGWLMTPTVGLTYSYKPVGYEANDNGGRTAMYQLAITGTEAMSYPALDKLTELLERFDPNADVSSLDLEA